MLQGQELMQEIESLINVNGAGLSKELLEFIASVMLLEDMSAIRELKTALNYLMSARSRCRLLGESMSNEELLEYLGSVIENPSKNKVAKQQLHEALSVIYSYLDQQGTEFANLQQQTIKGVLKIKNPPKMNIIKDVVQASGCEVTELDLERLQLCATAMNKKDVAAVRKARLYLKHY